MLVLLLATLVGCGRFRFGLLESDSGADRRADASTLDASTSFDAATGDATFAADASSLDASVSEGDASVSGVDAGTIDASVSPCELGPFGTPMPFVAVNSAVMDIAGTLTADGLAYFYGSVRAGGRGDQDIWVATRPDTSSPFSAPTNVTELNSSAADADPSIALDGLAIYFDSTRGGGLRVHRATRSSLADAFSAPAEVTELRTLVSDPFGVDLAGDGLSLIVMSRDARGAGGDDLWEISRPTPTAPFDAVRVLDEVNTPANESWPTVSADGLELFFRSDRSPASDEELYRAVRSTRFGAFGVPTPVGPPVDGASSEDDPELSPDGTTMFFTSNRPGGPGGRDIWMATRPCTPL